MSPHLNPPLANSATIPENQDTALELTVTGLVQGVGFRPFVHALAVRHDLTGWILNRNDGVRIRIQGASANLERFLGDLPEKAPPLARIERITTASVPLESCSDFRIIPSQSHSRHVTRVSPDVAVCPDCLRDMRQQARRRAYAFTNCTNCGPRFSIIQALPYDRQQTTMRAFHLCPACQREYDDVADRRFHAQPNACWRCGPRYTLIEGKTRYTDFDRLIKRICALLEGGKIVAIKGVGGFHLVCDATNEAAVAALRARKQREGKPLAVMARNCDAARAYAAVNSAEEALLLSEKRPIVLLKQRCASANPLAPSVTRGLDTVGIMLPYAPFHHVLFEHLRCDALVCTSGNRSDEPIVISNASAMERLAPVADAVAIYNRDIHNRCDDSVALVANGKPRLLRRSRGWAPEPVALPFEVEGIVATGGELKTCFAVGKGRQAIVSQHIGDLKNWETAEFYREAFARFQTLFRVTPTLMAHDLHPDYGSSAFARESGLPCVQVQHHHAHIAACMAEFGLTGPVIGISFDGTGLGDDGAIWGGEFLVCDFRSVQRMSHFDYVPMPGGDKAAEQPWRMGLAYLHAAFGPDLWNGDLPFARSLARSQGELLLQAVEAGIQSPPTSSVGRLFDAVAAICQIVSHATFEAEAPMRLEAAIDESVYRSAPAAYPYRIGATIDARPMIAAIVAELTRNVPVGVIAARFHQTLVAVMVEMAGRIREAHGLQTVVLSGGVFQNRHLLEHAEEALREAGFVVYSPLQLPANDGGLCVGQLAVAAHRSAL